MSISPALTPSIPTAESLVASIDVSTPTPAPISPTPDDLESLVTSLRASLTSSQTLLASQATRLATLADLETSLIQSRDQLTFLTAAKDAVELQLKDEIKKREVAEENVELLRGQVEQARRGVGLLQKQEKERKRLSTLPAGALGITYPEEEATGSKRQSMLNRGHRRISSQSDSLDVSSLLPSTSPNLGGPGPARAGGLRELRLGVGSTPPQPVSSPNSVNTGFFDEPFMAPSLAKRNSSAGVSTISSPPSKKDVAAQEEAIRLKGELHAVHARLAESEEARMASEACLKALREFMASGAPSTLDDTEISTAELLKGIRLPPLPTDRDPDEPELEGQHDKDSKAVPPTSNATGGWGFKLWKQPPPTSPALSTAVEPPATPMTHLSPPPSIQSVTTTPLLSPGLFPSEETLSAMPNNVTPLSNFVTGWTKSVSPGTPGETKATRKLTNFFSRGGKKDESASDKALSIRPNELDENGAQVVVVEGGEGLEPSPEISDLVVGKGKRESRPTPKTIDTALEEEVGTPAMGTSISLDSDDGLEGGAKKDKAAEA